MAQKKITDEQLQEELNAGMKIIDIARKYGISDRVIRIRKAKLAKKGVGHGRDVSHLVPDGYKIKGTSSLVDEFGNTKLQWVKTDTDAERQVELMKAVIEGMKSEITPVAPVKVARAKRNDKLLNLYTVSDFHLGMLAWADESGDDWDMKIAEDLFSRWFDAAFQKAPDAGTGVINLLGDFAHFDSLDADRHLVRIVGQLFTVLNIDYEIGELDQVVEDPESFTGRKYVGKAVFIKATPNLKK